MITGRARGDRGSVLVETALAASVLFTIILAAIAFAVNEAGDSSGSNAAREGARRGIVDYDQADTVGSNAYLDIQAAVRAKLAGLVAGAPAVTVRCYTSTGTQKACTRTGIAPGTDQIEVRVTWSRLTSSPFTGNSSKTDVARMTIVGMPPSPGSVGGNGSCVLSMATTNPSTVTRTGGGLDAPVTISVVVSSLSQCGTPLIYTLGPVGEYAVTPPISMIPGSGSTFTYTIPAHNVGNANPADDDAWTNGVKTVTITPPVAGVGAATSFYVGVPCTISGLNTSPSPLQVQNRGFQSDTTFTVTSSGDCSALQIGFTGAGWSAPAPNPAPLSGGPTTWTITYAAGAGNGTNKQSTITVTIYSGTGATLATYNLATT